MKAETKEQTEFEPKIQNYEVKKTEVKAETKEQTVFEPQIQTNEASNHTVFEHIPENKGNENNNQVYSEKKSEAIVFENTSDITNFSKEISAESISEQNTVSETEYTQYSEKNGFANETEEIIVGKKSENDHLSIQKNSFGEEIQSTEKDVLKVNTDTDFEAGEDRSSDSGENENTFLKESRTDDIFRNSEKSDEKGSNVADDASPFEKLVAGAVTMQPIDFIGRSEVFMFDDTQMQQNILNQTYKALNEYIPGKHNVFVMRLNPEGLGNITVRMIKSEGSVIVRMLTDNTKTAELLNRELNILQDLLKPHNAEIQTVECHKPDDTNQNFMNFDQSGYSQSSQFAEEYKNSGRRYFMSSFNGTDEVPEDQNEDILQRAVIVQTGMLNRFI